MRVVLLIACLFVMPLAACAPQYRGAAPVAPEAHAMPVADVQAGLARLGFEPGPVDGLWGPRTRAAVINYQRLRGLPDTGRIDRPFAESLRAEMRRLPPAPPEPETRIARAPEAGGIDAAPLPGAARDGMTTGPAGRPATDARTPAPDTLYRKAEHDPSLVAQTGTDPATLSDVRYAEVDLDGDGDLDVIWNNASSRYCGDTGCSFDVYFREGAGWRAVARLLAFEVDVASGRTRGVRDLLVTGRRGSTLWQWNGRHYAPTA